MKSDDRAVSSAAGRMETFQNLLTKGTAEPKSWLKLGRRSPRAMHQLAASKWLGKHCSDRTQPITLAAGKAAGRGSWHE